MIVSGMTPHNFCCKLGDVWRDVDEGDDSSSDDSDNVHALPASDNASLQRNAIAAYFNSPIFEDV